MWSYYIVLVKGGTKSVHEFAAARTRQTQHMETATFGDLHHDPSSCANPWFWQMLPVVSTMCSGDIQDYEPLAVTSPKYV